MSQIYEYTFVRLEKRAKKEYQEVIGQYARDGFRLVQIFAPGAGGVGAGPKYVELIFERPAG